MLVARKVVTLKISRYSFQTSLFSRVWFAKLFQCCLVHVRPIRNLLHDMSQPKETCFTTYTFFCECMWALQVILNVSINEFVCLWCGRYDEFPAFSSCRWSHSYFFSASNLFANIDNRSTRGCASQSHIWRERRTKLFHGRNHKIKEDELNHEDP